MVFFAKSNFTTTTKKDRNMQLKQSRAKSCSCDLAGKVKECFV